MSGHANIYGCMDPLACNYSPQNTVNDASCWYNLAYLGCTCDDGRTCNWLELYPYLDPELYEDWD